jgi:D-threo-aldose 1-dehydrogenase
MSTPPASLLPTAQVGSTALRVPVIGLGTAPIGRMWTDVPETQAVATVQYALEQGVTFFDTAPYYDATLVETRVGLALQGIPRHSYTLATKVGRLITPDRADLMDFTRDGVRRSLEGSLTRLKVDHVDILHIHDPDAATYQTAMAEAYPFLADLRREAVIKAVGVGVNYWEPLLDFARDGQFDCFLLAGRYTLLEQGALAALNQFHAQGISIFGAGVYNTGILAKGSKSGAWYQYRAAPAPIVEKVARLEALCQRHDVPLNAAAVQFVKAHPAVTSLVIGAESPAQLGQSIEAIRAPIPAAFWAELRAAGLIDAAAPVPAAE